MAKSVVRFIIVQEFLNSVGGEYALDLIKVWEKKKKLITDEELGKALPIKITEIRAILNRLHYRGIVAYQKTRNAKTGWYSYAWEVKPKRIADLILTQQSEEMHKLENIINYEKNYVFFACKKKCNNLPFEIAAEYHFKCPECSGVMDPIDNNRRIRELKRKIQIIRSEICQLQKMSP